MNENWLLDEFSRSARLLAAIDETGSFTQAAARLGLQQSAVSHRIKRLESELGTPLFDRTTRRVAATATGRILCDAAAQDLALWRRALQAHAASRTASRMKLSVSSSLAMKWLLPALPRIKEAGLDVGVEVEDEIATFDFEAPLCAIRFGNGPYPGLFSTRLAKCYLQPVASPSYHPDLNSIDAFLGKSDVTFLEDARGDRDGTGYSWKAYIDGAGLAIGRAFNRLTLGRADLVIQAAVSGNGIALGRTLLMERDIGMGLLRRIGPPVLMSSAYWLVCLPSFAQTDGFKTLRDLLLAEAALAARADPDGRPDRSGQRLRG